MQRRIENRVILHIDAVGCTKVLVGVSSSCLRKDFPKLAVLFQAFVSSSLIWKCFSRALYLITDLSVSLTGSLGWEFQPS